MTGLFNRRYLKETLERELQRASRKKLTLGVIMLDVDGFKQFNDSFGHIAGDAILQELGAMLLANVRKEDIPSRYGGDEFIIVMPDASQEVTHKRAEVLREKVHHIHIQSEGQALDPVTLSIGIAIIHEDGLTSAAVLKTVDAALYRAKREGRDRVVSAPGGLQDSDNPILIPQVTENHTPHQVDRIKKRTMYD